MNAKTDTKPDGTPRTSADESDYLEWRDAKVSKALDASRLHPEQRVPQAEVWKKFGLES